VNKPTGLHILIRNSAGGDHHAQTELYERVSQPLVKHVLNRYGNSLQEEDAWEIMHQTVLQMYINASHFAGIYNEVSAWSWAYSIARNQALKWIRISRRTEPILDIRRENLEREQFDDEEALFEIVISENNRTGSKDALEIDVIEKLIWKAVYLCILQLEPKDRELLDLRYARGYTLEEIAQIHHITKPRVHQRLDRIIRILRKAAQLDGL